MSRRLQRQAGVDAEAALGQRPGLERAAEHRRALAHPRDPAAGAVRGRAPCRRGRRRGRRARAAPGAERTVTSARRRAGVAQRVRERLLHDPVGGQVDARGQRGRVGRDLARARRPRGRRRAAARRARRAGRGPAAGAPARRRRPAARRRAAGAARASASRPADSIERSAARAWSGRSSNTSSAADACTTITETLWAITSCSSRAIRACSSPTARRDACVDRDPAVARGLAERPGDDREQHRERRVLGRRR